MNRLRYLLPIILLLAACAPIPAPMNAATAIPFPTMTPGSLSIGYIPTAIPENAALSNPATAVALASRPTATPNYAACPPTAADVSFTAIVERGLTIPNGIPAYLNAGGTPAQLQQALADGGFLSETGLVSTDHDFTGERVPELLATFTDPTEGGVLMLLACENGSYITRYQSFIGDTAPQIVRVGDMNFDRVLDVLYTAQECSPVDGFCEYRTGILTWDTTQGRFVNLLSTSLDGDIPPTFGDIDNDNVIEVITIQQSRGTTETGPILTGSQVYDWNGVSYVLSLSQPDPLRYVIQVIHEADRAFREERANDAARLYTFTLNNPDLAYWFGGDEASFLDAYARYRLLLTYTFAENGDPLTAYEELTETYPNMLEAPVYAIMAQAFWEAYQTSNNLNTACNAVRELIAERPLALELLNRYGTRNPTYTAQSLCPF